METVEIQLKSLCCGNEKIDMYFNDYKISFYASYLGQEPLALLVQAVYELKKGGIRDVDSDETGYESDIQWMSEPRFLEMTFHRKDDILHIHLKTADEFEDKAIMKEERCFSVSFRTFKYVVIRESLRMLRKYGIRGYYESWSDHRDFPLGMLLTLLGCSSDEKKLGMYISNLASESKLLNEYEP